MRTSRVSVRTLLPTAAAALVLATAAPTLAGTGARFDVLEARAWYQRPTADPCVVEELILFVGSGRSHLIGEGATRPGEGQSAAALMSSIDTCQGQVVGQRSGWTPLGAGEAAFDGLESVSLELATIVLTGAGSDVTVTLSDFSWTGGDESSPWVWHRTDERTALAWDGGPFGSGTHHTERYVGAAVVGTVVLGDGTTFLADDFQFGEIGTVPGGHEPGALTGLVSRASGGGAPGGGRGPTPSQKASHAARSAPSQRSSSTSACGIGDAVGRRAQPGEIPEQEREAHLLAEGRREAHRVAQAGDVPVGAA